MKLIKMFFTISVLLGLFTLIFKYSIWSINIILLAAILLLVVDIFYAKA